MATDDRALAAAQRAYDNAVPGVSEPEWWRCVQCGHLFHASEAEEGHDDGADCWICPACGDNDIARDQPEQPEPDEPDDSVDEAAEFGGREYP